MTSGAPEVMPRVDILVVLWKSKPFIAPLLHSVAQLRYPRAQLTLHVVRNGPADETWDEFTRVSESLRDQLPAIVTHIPERNLGFAGGNNLVLRQLIAGERGADEPRFAYLLNHDAAFEPDALTEAVAAAQAHPRAAAVQSLIVLASDPDTINTAGNHIHYLGFGYCGQLGEPRAAAGTDPVPITYASGAGVLLRLSALREVGLFDEALFAYHEDLDLGWRMRLLNWEVLLAPRSVVHHHYEFGRNQDKWFFMERNRLLVLLKNLDPRTFLLLLPQLLALEVGLLGYAAVSGWLPAKLRAQAWFLRPGNLRGLLAPGARPPRNRPDAEVFAHLTSRLQYPGFESPAVKALAYPVFDLGKRLVGGLLRW